MAIEKFLDLGKPAPVRDPIADGKSQLLAPAWHIWFARLTTTLASIPNVVGGMELAGQEASIPATDFSGAVLPAGVYRASYRIRVTRAATTSSSLTVTIAWTDGGVALSFVGAALTGNTTATYQQETIVLRSDAAAVVTFAVTYGSVGATAMQYAVDVFLEKLRG